MSAKSDSQRITLDRNNTNFTAQLFEFLKAAKWSSEYDFLKYYQNITRVFMKDVDIDARGLLITLVMGMGKSLLAISIAMDNIKDRQPIILLTKSLETNMREQIQKYVQLRKSHEPDYYLGRLSSLELDQWIEKNFSFVSMNASNMLKQMGKAAEGQSNEEFSAALEKRLGELVKIASLDGKLLIVDEAHNLFRAITNGSKNAQGVYDMVMKAKNLKVVFLTGTPIANDPFELVPCFNMLGSKRGAITLPETYSEFRKLFVDEKNKTIKNKEKFQNRILGLVSHVGRCSIPGKAIGITESASAAVFPEEYPIIVEKVNMDREQYVIYQLARDKEKEEGKGGIGMSFRSREPPTLTKPKSHASSTYRVKSRQLGNYCPPAAFRDTSNVAHIPAQYVTSPKFRRILEIIKKHPNQPGIIYSQFTGMGGLASLARFLDSQGWSKVEIKPRENGTPADTNLHDVERVAIKLNKYEHAAPGEQGELDEYLPEPAMTSVREGASSFYGAAVPPVDAYLDDIYSEAEHVDYSHWLGGYDKDEPSIENDPWIVEQNNYRNGANEDPKLNLVFKYATADDIPAIVNIDPHANITPDLFVYPNKVILVYLSADSQNNKLIGYALAKVITVNKKISNDKFTATIESYALVKEKVYLCTECSPAHMDTILDSIESVLSGNEPELLKTGGADKQTYALITGEVDIDSRTALKNMVNDIENAHGEIIDLLMISSTGAEGLDLKRIRFVIAMEPYWNWSRIMQLNARANRNNSHEGLPEDEKNVQPYLLLAVPPETERLRDGSYPETTDTELYEESITGQRIVDSFNQALNEVSIECVLNGESNCRRCSPTDKPLFSDDIARDVRSKDPCEAHIETRVTAEEVVIDGVSYYFAADPTSVFAYKVFIYDKNIDGYRRMPEYDERFETIITAIEEKNAKLK